MSDLEDAGKAFKAALEKYELLVKKIELVPEKKTSTNYRRLAFDHYGIKTKDGELSHVFCAVCGFGIREVLEVAHLNCDRSRNEVENLAILCRNCHRMHDLDLISTPMVIVMRDRLKLVKQSKLMKDAGAKAARTKAQRVKWKKAGLKAVETKKRNAAHADAVLQQNAVISPSPD